MNDQTGSSATPGQQLRLYTSTSYACNYLAEQQACAQVIFSNEKMTTAIYAELIEKGFRRSGMTVYRPHCLQCHACIPLRVPVNLFIPNRAQRRAIAKHGQLQAHISSLTFQPEHYALYQSYQRRRHAKEGASHMNEEEYRDFILTSSVDTILVEFRDSANSLKAVALIDRLPQALSAVYTFFADDAGAAYGTYVILWQIAQAHRWQLPYVYLGYWIANSAKMHYKIHFLPCEVLRNGRWMQLDKSGKTSSYPQQD